MPSRKDKRQFKRYKYKTEFSLSFQQNHIRAFATNYSLKGIGFFIDNAARAALDSNVHIKIEDLNIDEDGKVIWSRKENTVLKGGIERKSISGLLKYFPVADILLDLHRSENNGILEITHDQIIKRIYIKNGDMVYATSNMQEDRLLEILLRARKITNDQYYQSVDISNKKGKSYGAALVELGFLKPEDLTWVVRRQVEQIIMGLFHWENAKFVFLEGSPVSNKFITLKLSAADLIYNGIKSIKDMEHIKKAMPPPDTVFHYSTDPIDLFQDINLNGDDKGILYKVDGKRSIKEILSISPMDNFQTMKTLYALINTRIIEIKGKELPENAVREEILKEHERKAPPDFIKKVDELCGKLDYIDHYSFLGIEKSSTLDKIKKAYYKGAKQFHPDRHLHLQSDTLKNKLNAIFAHLTEVYKVLSNQKERIKYDQTLSVKPAKLQTGNVERARVIFNEGEDAFRRGFFSKAKELFGKAIYLDSSASAYYYNLGLVFAKEGNFHEAGKILSQAVKIDPFNPEYLAELGHIYLKLGFQLRAKSTFEKVIRLDPSNERALRGMQMIKDMQPFKDKLL